MLLPFYYFFVQYAKLDSSKRELWWVIGTPQLFKAYATGKVTALTHHMVFNLAWNISVFY